MTDQYVQFRVKSIFSDLTRSEKKIAKFIMEQPQEVIKMTASQLAKISGTSPASVIRFCKSIGIPSFSDLKLELSAERQQPVAEDYSDILPNETIPDLKVKLLGNAHQALKETIQLADEASLLNATHLISEASLIYIYGMGSSYLVAENFAQKWNRIGKTCICLPDVHQLISNIASAPRNTLFIAISTSGETPEVLSLVQIAQSRELKTMSLTEFGINSLSKTTDVHLNTVRSRESDFRSAATSSLMSQFMLIDLLFYTYILNDYENHMTHITQSRDLVTEYKKINRKK